MVPRPRATLRPCVDAIAETEGWGRGAELPLRKEASFPSHLSIVQGSIDGYMKTPLNKYECHRGMAFQVRGTGAAAVGGAKETARIESTM